MIFMSDWFAKLDPNVVATILTAIGAGGAWLYHRIKGDQVDSFDDAIRGIGKQAIHELLIDPSVSAAMSPIALTDKATAIMSALAMRLGIPVNAITTALIRATAQHVIGDVLAELRAQAGLQDQIDQLSAQVSSIPAQLAKTEADAFARGKNWAAQNVEVVTDTGHDYEDLSAPNK